MKQIRIYQREYALPAINAQKVQTLEQDIQRSRSVLSDNSSKEPQGFLEQWFSRSKKLTPSEEIDARFQELDNIVKNYKTLMQLLQTHKHEYQGFFQRVIQDVHQLIQDKAVHIQNIEDKRQKQQQEHDDPALQDIYIQQKLQLLELVRTLSQEAILALKKLELFSDALEELAENQDKQQQVLAELLKVTIGFRSAYELQKEIDALENDLNNLLQQSLNLEKLIAPYLGPFQTLIEQVSQTDTKLIGAVREIQTITEEILNTGGLSLSGKTEEKILDFLVYGECNQQFTEYLSDWNLTDALSIELDLQHRDEATVKSALDNLQQFLELRYPDNTNLLGVQNQVQNQEDLDTQGFERYIINNDAAVLDKKTGLIWMRCALGQTWNGITCVGKAKRMDWQTACQQIGDGFAGYDDWRIPTLEELKTLVDKNQTEAKIQALSELMLIQQ